eukprot:m.38201 g.38201  ORF g.38201 m.38201 type:complete len:347 (+) comp5622_c0_seq2:338-1378(+)
MATASETGATPSPTFKTITTRLMLPDDANPAGNVHGGTILQLIEQAGYIAATRHCGVAVGSATSKYRGCALASLSECTFERPIRIGDVARCDAVVSYAKSSSIEVSVNVHCEDLTKGTIARSNRARLWYVLVEEPKDADRHGSGPIFVPVKEVPPVANLSHEAEAAGAARYDAERKQPAGAPEGVDDWTAEDTLLGQLMLPSDCTVHGIAFGGTLMKLMDNAAGIRAYTHCKTNVVTVSIGDLRLVSPALNGSVVTIAARITFTSSRSMEIQVLARCMTTAGTRTVASAHFNFVSLDKTGRPTTIPQIEPTTAEEKARFAAGAQRYEETKQKRAAAAKAKAMATTA